MATPSSELAKVEPLNQYIRKPEVMERFADALGGNQNAIVFVQSVLILVQSSEPGEYSLQNCSNQSIVRAALRAITLRVSVDPAVRQAWLVPRKNKDTGKIEACLQLHYAEVRNRAMRTGRYYCINVSPVYEGEIVMQNVYTGMHKVFTADGLIATGSPNPMVTLDDGWFPVSSRRGKVIGWLGYSKTNRGAERSCYMTIQDIEAHIAKAQTWGTSTKAWKQNRETMEKKTVLLMLLRGEDLGDPQMEKVKQVLEDLDEQDPDIIQGETKPADETPRIEAIAPKPTEAENLSALGFDEPAPKKKRRV